ncbi:MAG: hypothetical protein KAJ91_02230 [Candidatus Aenigmarchaeota archaeon]|nr:hypothetical protein [Candidatus Aenigmarchaeota archaeon]
MDKSANEKNTLPQEIQKVYEASDVPFGYNEDADLINSVLWKLDEYDSWKKPNISPESCTLFSKNVYENTEGRNPVNTMSCEIIYAFSDRPIAESIKECRQIRADLRDDLSLTQTDVGFNAFFEEPTMLKHLKGNVHPKTGETMHPVPVGYIVRDANAWYREDLSANQSSCQRSYCMDRNDVLETYCILDFVLEGLKKSVGAGRIHSPSNVSKRLSVIPTKH